MCDNLLVLCRVNVDRILAVWVTFWCCTSDVLLLCTAGHFLSRTLSMESPLSVVQSFVCSLPNTCHQDGQDDLVDAYPGAAWVCFYCTYPGRGFPESCYSVHSRDEISQVCLYCIHLGLGFPRPVYCTHIDRARVPGSGCTTHMED